MGKKKTRQEKKISDLHRQLALSHATPKEKTSSDATTRKQIYTLPQQATFYKSTPQPHEYAYVTHDVLKTAFLTSIIVASQLILYFLLHMHVIKLPGLGY